MSKINKSWVTIVAVIFLAVGLMACSDTSNPESAQPSVISPKPAEEVAKDGPDLATDDIAYLTQLALMRGHLFVGKELYLAGHIEHAKTHMKHPESELYADIEPAFTARGSGGFAKELQALANTVENELSSSDVESAFAVLSDAISASEAKVAGTAEFFKSKLNVIVNLLRVAGEEYAIAVVEGKMENAHEYQDAFGFTQIAKTLVSDAESLNSEEAFISDKVGSLLISLDEMWPGIVPPPELETESSQLYDVAAEIEMLASDLN